MGYSFKLLERSNSSSLTDNLANSTEVLGSLSGYKLDGRLGLTRAVGEATEYYLQEKRLRPNLIGFNLYYNGRLEESFCLD